MRGEQAKKSEVKKRNKQIAKGREKERRRKRERERKYASSKFLSCQRTA
jgi:hypothetical protein